MPSHSKATTAENASSTKPLGRIFQRQRFLLQFLNAFGGTLSDQNFQQLLFLFRQTQSADEALYDFIPGEHGPTSFSAAHDRTKLIERGDLQSSADTWSLTKQGAQTATETPAPDVGAFLQEYGQLRDNALTAACYQRAPYYATRSHDASHLLGADAATRKAITKASKHPSGTALFSIGYEGISFERYLNLLLEHGVTILADVRKNPLSHKFGFSKTILSTTVQSLGITYHQFPELGIASAKRKDLKTPEDYQKLFEDYRLHWLPKQGEPLEQLQDWLARGERIALTCFEHEHLACHRHCVSDLLEQRLTPSITTVHL